MTEASVSIELERDLQAALPDWIEQEPSRWQQVQYALRKAAQTGPTFATFEEFIHWVDEDTSAEWENGEVVFMSPASTRHQLIAGFLHKLLGFYVDAQNLGVVLSAPYKMKLEGYGPEPDLIVVLEENEERLRENHLDGPADLAIEVVSPDSIGRDRGRKFIAYEEAGLPEYWLIDPAREVAEFYRLGDDGRYQLSRISQDGRYTSQILPGFWLQVDWLWQMPLPSALDALRQLEVI